MKKCAYCGRENRDAAITCVECGTEEFTNDSHQEKPSDQTVKPSQPIKVSAYLMMFGAVLLAVPACFMSWVAIIARADSEAEVRAGVISDWVMQGPLWALTVFLSVRAWMRDNPHARSRAVRAGVVVWVVVAVFFNFWEQFKMWMRSG